MDWINITQEQQVDYFLQQDLNNVEKMQKQGDNIFIEFKNCDEVFFLEKVEGRLKITVVPF